MSHPAVAEAAVVAMPSAKWGERPLLVVVLRGGEHGGGAGPSGAGPDHEAVREQLYK